MMATRTLQKLSHHASFSRGCLRQCKRWYAKSWKKKVERQERVENTVFQYAGGQRVDRVYVWGYSATGALGIREFLRPEAPNQKGRSRQMAPRRLGFFDDLKIKVKEVGCGYGFTVYVCEQNGEPLVYGTGINTDSQLGFQEYPKNSGRILDYIIEPVPIELPTSREKGFKVMEVGCSRAHTVITTNAGKIFTLGNNAYGQCGRTIVENEVYRGNPIINTVEFDEPVKQVVCGQDHTLLLTEKGEIFTCGLGADGQTGLGHYQCAAELTRVKGDIEGEKIVSISSASDTVLAVSEKGDLFGWGNSEYSQLSMVTDSTQVNIPRHLPFQNVGRVVDAAAGGSICGLVNDQGQVYVWGFGILGKGPKLEQSREPSLIPPPIFGINEFSPDSKVTHIDCGINYFIALTNDNNLYSWGRNNSSVLGLGHILDQFFPFRVLLPAEVQKISCGVDHVVAFCKSFS